MRRSAIMSHNQYKTRLRSRLAGYRGFSRGIRNVDPMRIFTMFTFIRIRLPNLKPIDPAAIERFREEADPASASPQDKHSGGNPWKGELERLGCGGRSDTDQVYCKKGPNSRQAPPPPPLPNSPPAKNLTITMQKIWWGKATYYQTPDPRELSKFSPARPQKPNRWKQF